MARARPFYFLVGEPSPTRSYAEGFDGAAWEYYADPGLVLRTTGAPAAASRHTAYFDDPLVSSLEAGWSLELLGEEAIGGRPAYRIRATYPDSFQNEVFVDAETGLIVAYRKAAPIHAFGESVETETRVSDWRELNGALFPMRFEEYVIATGEPLSDVSGGWATAEVNPELPIDYFSPPSEPRTPLARMLNAVFLARSTPDEALAWYRDFRSNPATAAIDAEAGIEAMGYQCLKNGAVETAVRLLEANLAEHPDSADAHFGLGRAYRAAGREAEAVGEFQAALAIDPGHGRAAEALDQ
jgi:tetratricopeptide (TPR) repeat protein